MARGSGGKDTTAPVVNITFPANNQIFTSAQTITITATATDNRGVARVEFSVRNNATGAVGALATDTTSPYSASWPVPTQVGAYTITARAVDTSGNSATHSIIVNRTDSTTTTTTSTTLIPPPPLPASFRLVTPPVMGQGGEGSCLSCALAFVRSTDWYYQNNQTSYSTSTNIFSPEFLFDLVHSGIDTDCGAGSSMINSLQFLYDNGICKWDTLPYSSTNGCSSSIVTSPMRSEALNYKIPYYHGVYSTDIVQIKRNLLAGHASAVGATLDSVAYASSCGFIWNNRVDYMGAHAMFLIGWDDTKNAWLLQNSYGPNWGCNGCIWVDYNFFATSVSASTYWMF